jgi:hypothetical protein
MRRQQQLVSLLRTASGELEDVTVEDLGEYTDAGNVTSRELLDIYARRQETAGELFSGFPELLVALEQQGQRKVKVHTFFYQQRGMTAFTDPDCADLLGLLVERAPAP